MADDTTPYFGPAQDWGRIRSWDGTQYRAFEELCFQLRDPTPDGWRTIKTAAPDGGLEWYDRAPDGVVHGWQVKFVGSVEALIRLAGESARTVGANRANRNVVKLTFIAPIDLSDPAPVTAQGGQRVGARQKWDRAIARWSAGVAGLEGVEIDFLGAGELLERLNRPGNEGRRWFFFQELALGPDWCRSQFTLAERIAEDRYTPARHLSLPLERTIDGLVLRERFRRTLTERTGAAYDGVMRLQVAWAGWLDRHQRDATAALGAAGLVGAVSGEPWAPLTALIDRSVATVALLREGLADGEADRGLAAADAATLASECAELVWQFHSGLQGLVTQLESHSSHDKDPGADDPQDPTGATRGPVARPEEPAARLKSLTDGYSPVALAETALDRLAEFLRSDRARVAEAGAWLLLGGPGQGKTHLLLDAVRDLLDSGGVAVAVFGEQLIGEDPLTEIARVLGLGDLSHSAFLQALDAAGAASGTRFLLVIDALNDSDQPTRWRTQLPAMLSRIAEFNHVAVVFSCRTTMRDVVLPPNIDKFGLPATYHPGFRGREVEGLEKYLHDVPHALPRTPLLQASFSNPLFVKLYADTLRTHASGPSVATVSGTTHHRSAVFRTFLDIRAALICDHLGLDPASQPVQRAVQVLAERMASTGYEVLLREEARALVDGFAPHATTWPRTMLGELISCGVLATDRCVRRGRPPEAGVAFPYQAFSDDLIVRAALQRHQDDLAHLGSGAPLPEGSALRQWLQAASPNLQEAATVILPELANVELIDALAAATPRADHDDADGFRQYGLFRALVDTLPLRAGPTVTQRTRALLNQAAADHELTHATFDAIIAVSTEPGHLLNAHSLHRTLTALDPAERDAVWGIYTDHAYYEVGPLHRLLRWAEQLPTPQRLLPDQPTRQPALTARRAGTRPVQPSPADEPPADCVELAAIVVDLDPELVQPFPS